MLSRECDVCEAACVLPKVESQICLEIPLSRP